MERKTRFFNTGPGGLLKLKTYPGTIDQNKYRLRYEAAENVYTHTHTHHTQQGYTRSKTINRRRGQMLVVHFKWKNMTMHYAGSRKS
jgi:hypothetical protein